MAYVYQHVRLDKNEIFYIGIARGKNNTHHRAYNFHKSCRSAFWFRVFRKTQIRVDILHDNISIEEAKQKEIELIALHKRRCDGGTLVNHTLGGDGSKGSKRPKTAERNKTGFRCGMKHTLASRLLISKHANNAAGTDNDNYRGAVLAYRGDVLIGMFNTTKDAAFFAGCSSNTLQARMSRNVEVDGICYKRASYKNPLSDYKP